MTTGHALRRAAVTLLFAVVCGGASCVSSDGGTYGNGGGNYEPDRPDDRYNDFDADRPNRIPRRADAVREGTERLRWRADLDGTVYVYDREKDVIRYTGPVRRGDDVLVQPDDDRVAVGGRVVSAENLRRDGTHVLYFAPAGAGAWRDSDQDRPPRPAAPAPAAAAGLPSGARKLARSSGVVEIAKLPDAARVYVYDEDTRAVVYQTALRRGSSFRVVPREGKVYANGELIERVRFANGHTLALYVGER